MRILLVEDDKTIVSSLTEFLEGEGFSVCNAIGQSAAAAAVGEEQFDLILLDISLADGNGFGFCATLRKHSKIPVIFLTASGDEYSVVTGLELGAEDYICKPFRPKELVARIRTVLRRCGAVQTVSVLGPVTVDTVKGTVTKNGAEIALSALEYKLLLVFLANKNAILSRNRLLEEIWDIAGDFVNDNTLTVYIKRLREKIEDDPQRPTLIKTVRGLGYRAEDGEA